MHNPQTSLIQSFIGKVQPEALYEPTIENNFHLSLNGISLNIMDVGGHPFYSTLWPSAILAADAFLLVYDVCERRSFDLLWPLYRQIVQIKQTKNLPILLVGNMVDTILTQGRARQVTPEMAAYFSNLVHIPAMETTAKALKSTAQCFKSLIQLIQKRASDLVREKRIELALSRQSAHATPPRSLAHSNSSRSSLEETVLATIDSDFKHAHPHLKPLAPASADSLRYRRDKVFSSWKSFKQQSSFDCLEYFPAAGPALKLQSVMEEIAAVEFTIVGEESSVVVPTGTKEKTLRKFKSMGNMLFKRF